MDAETRGKVKALEEKILNQNRKTAQVYEESVRLEKKVYEMQSCIDRQADQLAELSNSELARENERLASALKEIADGRGKYAKLAKDALAG